MHQALIIDNAIADLKKLRAKFPAKPHEAGAEMPDSSVLNDASRTLNRLTQDLAFLAEYADWRGGAGCGDHGEVKATKKAEARLKKVRKALGYYQ